MDTERVEIVIPESMRSNMLELQVLQLGVCVRCHTRTLAVTYGDQYLWASCSTCLRVYVVDEIKTQEES
jgi:hypothetical protein